MKIIKKRKLHGEQYLTVEVGGLTLTFVRDLYGDILRRKQRGLAISFPAVRVNTKLHTQLVSLFNETFGPRS